MNQKYFLTLAISLLFSIGISAQNSKDIGFYPNPVNTGKIYITSKSSMEKEVTVFNVLGKQVLQQQVSKELSVSGLSPGVYMIRIKEGEAVVTRKLIVK